MFVYDFDRQQDWMEVFGPLMAPIIGGLADELIAERSFLLGCLRGERQWQSRPALPLVNDLLREISAHFMSSHVLVFHATRVLEPKALAVDGLGKCSLELLRNRLKTMSNCSNVIACLDGYLALCDPRSEVFCGDRFKLWLRREELQSTEAIRELGFLGGENLTEQLRRHIPDPDEPGIPIVVGAVLPASRWPLLEASQKVPRYIMKTMMKEFGLASEGPSRLPCLWAHGHVDAQHIKFVCCPDDPRLDPQLRIP